MVKGLEKFKEHFSEFNDQYILIGGTACSMALETRSKTHISRTPNYA